MSTATLSSDIQNPSKLDFEPCNIWNLPLAPFTMQDTLDAVDEIIDRGVPSYFITANLNYAMVCENRKDLEELNRRAAFIIADGMPMVWASRLTNNPLPERVAGSDLIFELCKRAAEKGHRVFFLGGSPDVVEQATQNLQSQFPGLQIVGKVSPPYRELSKEEEDDLLDTIREAQADLLFVAFGQPKGELWITKHLDELNIPAAVQVGASFDFAAGRIPRAPQWIRRSGLEWVYRIYREPKRLAGRYWKNFQFLLRYYFGKKGRSMKASVC